VALEEGVKQLAQAANFAVLSTLLPDGHLQTHIMWVDADDDHVYVNTEVGRQKYLNIRRNPVATISIWEKGNPYRYAEVRGEVVEEIKGEAALESIDRLSHKYTGGPYPRERIGTERVVLKVRPDRQIVRG
jgi:PPOX class probable F420-dependent enzyme